jgi:L-fucose isomerase-like protein
MASNIAIYTLTSELHDEEAIRQVTEEFLSTLEVVYELKGDDYSDFGSHALDLIYVRTGGTEGIFKRMLPELQKKHNGPFRLLTSGKSNSLAASLEILAYLRKHNIHGEIVHGSPEYINKRLHLLEKVGLAKRQLTGCRLGVIGQPSDWLISSYANRETIKWTCGIELVDIRMQELMAILEQTPETMPDEHCEAENIRQSLPGANRIYLALKTLIERHHLQGFTLRCFDLLTSMHNTGCLALAKLNSEGYVAGCEGDVPAMVTMMIVRSLTGVSGFQANPSSIDPETGEMLFAHCTIPLNMVERYELDTHFESGIGVGIRGYMKPGPVTIFKVSGDMQSYFIAEGELVRNEAKPDLCRTQQVIQLADKNQVKYFLKNPIGNHHIILPGHLRGVLEEILK